MPRGRKKVAEIEVEPIEEKQIVSDDKQNAKISKAKLQIVRILADEIVTSALKYTEGKTTRADSKENIKRRIRLLRYELIELSNNL